MMTPAATLSNARLVLQKSTSIAIILLLSLLTNACGILTESESVAHVRYNYPADFGQFLQQNNASAEYDDLVYFLASHDVHHIVPVWQLLQQGSDWKTHALPKYAIPDREHWEKMVNTLVFLKYDLLPYIGPVNVLSGFRTSRYNQLAGGAGKSRHLKFSALDLRPKQKIDRAQLHGILQNRWHNVGKNYKLGLGLYRGLRFHIDTGGHRQW